MRKLTMYLLAFVAYGGFAAGFVELDKFAATSRGATVGVDGLLAAVVAIHIMALLPKSFKDSL